MVSTDPRLAFGHIQLSQRGLIAELLRQVGEPTLLYLYDVTTKRLDPLIRRTCRRPCPTRTERVPGGRGQPRRRLRPRTRSVPSAGLTAVTARACSAACGIERRSSPQVELSARPGGEHVAECAGAAQRWTEGVDEGTSRGSRDG